MDKRSLLFSTIIIIILMFSLLLPALAHATESLLPIPGKTNVGLVKYAYSAVEEGWGYILGSSGQVLTESRLDYFMAAEPEIYDTEESIAYAKQWLGKRVADCSGLIRSYLTSEENGKKISTREYPFLSSMSSVWYKNTTEAKKGDMSTMPETLGIILHRTNHVAVYIGHGKIIEAKGLRHGVVISDFIPSEWEMWVMPNCIDYLTDGFYTVGDAMYCLQNGTINTGWVNDSLGNIYYVDTDGSTFTGVRNIGGTNYLFSETGICYGIYTDEGLVFNDGYYYYYRGGQKQTGWIDLDNKLFYFDQDGRQLRNIACIVEGRAYLFLEDGSLNKASGSVICGGYEYKCSYNGEPMRGYINKVFYGEHFLPHTGFQTIGAELFYFEEGKPLSPGFSLIHDKWYYIKDNGSVTTGDMLLNGRMYECGETGAISVGTIVGGSSVD